MKSLTPGASRNLALILQEVLTAVVRLRANPQTVSDAESFRAHMLNALRTAEGEARQAGYSGGDVRLAVFAVVAFLDESVLNSRSPVFASWPRKPLQEEIFGGNIAGETFYTNVQNLLRGGDSANVADVLEVYELCLLLGYGGRYSLGNRGELHGIKQAIADKIRRIRGVKPLTPDWEPGSGDGPRVEGDPTVRRLTYAAIACALLCALLFVGFKLSLNSGVTSIDDLSTRQAAVNR